MQYSGTPNFSELYYQGGSIRSRDTTNKLLYHDVSTDFGSSGTPLLNIDGKVVGMHCGASSELRTNSILAGVNIIDLNNQSKSPLQIDHLNLAIDLNKYFEDLVIIQALQVQHLCNVYDQGKEYFSFTLHKLHSILEL